MTYRYVALMRGINVGGNNKISMTELKSAFEQMGFSNVSTYINSGNVIFSSDISNRAQVEKLIQEKSEKLVGFKLKPIVRSLSDITNTISHFPPEFASPDWKHNIIFLGDDINSPNILNNYGIKPEIEKVSYHDGVIYWSALWASGTRAVMYKLSARPEYQQMTVRSIGTVKKILELLTK